MAFGLENHGLPQEKIRQRVNEAFRIFHLERLKDRNVYELSSGERQLISILSAWAMDTEIFLFDEPTANLDFAATQQLKSILFALKKQGKALLLSEHRLYYLAGIADEYWVMENGKIQGKYPAEEARKFSPEQRQVLSLRTLDLAEISVPEKPQLQKAVAEVLRVSDICYTYKRKSNSTLSGISFSVQMHEIIGLVGSNGCGKTTLGKLIAGLYRPSGGRIALFGKLQNPKKLQKQVLFIMQEAEFQFFTNSVLHELQYGHSVTPEFEKRTEALLKSMDMWDCRDRHPFSLSGEEMQRPKKAKKLPADNAIELKNVCFAYHDKEVLHGINLHIAPGTVNALVGPSGSGKSTIARLIASLWEVKDGAIELGGVDIRQLPLKDCTDRIAYVSQDNYLFDLSVMDNIRMGRKGASDREVIDAAKKCGCHAFIMGLENGYQTMCETSGGHLSGGERQRISIARAMLKDAPIVILDEATSYTDPENEAVIQSALAQLVQGKTLLVIAHRLSTITDADQIIVVNQGRIEATGTQEELLASCPLYQTMWEAHINVKDNGEVA